MDLIGGGDLEVQIGTGPVAIFEAVGWIVEACSAIQHAHDNGIIHCDLKPSNLLLDRDRKIRVTDFGLARSVADELVDISGTPGFMAPEQVSGYWGPISPRTDVYGLGSVLYALLTGRPPYDGNRIADVLAKVVSAQTVCPPSQSRPEISDSLNDICQRCLSKSPDARFATARELHDALGPLHET
jgi:serine/threonine-protein kinase